MEIVKNQLAYLGQERKEWESWLGGVSSVYQQGGWRTAGGTRGERAPQEWYLILKTERDLGVDKSEYLPGIKAWWLGRLFGRAGQSRSQGEMLNWVAKIRTKLLNSEPGLWRQFGKITIGSVPRK